MFILNVVSIGMVFGAVFASVHVDHGFAEDIFWVIRHIDPLVTTRLDPIMNPGEMSNHVHAVVGGSNFGLTYDYDNSMASNCTTANNAIDNSNYWAPQMYHKNDNDTYSIGVLDFAHTYYLMRRADKEPVYEFPAGFRMLAGDPNRRTLDVNDPAQDAVGYTCLGASDLTRRHEFPTQQCSQGVRAELNFPNCWDGIHSWLEGSKHVAYGDGKYDAQGAKCPPTHPKRIMSLLYEFTFVDAAEYNEGSRYFANGDNTGYSFHADFTTGWKPGFFQDIFDQGRECSVQFALDECGPLALNATAREGHPLCPYKGVQVVENIGFQGSIAKLPGNNPHVEGYKETASFNSGTPANSAVAAILATDIRMGTVKGDPSHPVPPDAIPQTGLATSGYAQATSAVASGYSAPANTGTVASAQAASSATAAAASSNIASVTPGGGVVLAGVCAPSVSTYNSASTSAGSPDAVSSSIPASSPSAVPAAASVVVGADGTAEEMMGASNVAVRPPARKQVSPKGCGRGGRKGPYRSAM